MTVPNEIVLALIGVMSTVAAAWVGRGYTRRQKETEATAARIAEEEKREATRRATEEARWKRLEDDVARLDSELKAVRAENDELRRQNAQARARDVEAQDQLRDKDELIEDLLVYLIVRQDWEAGGSTPPSPVLSWRVQAALRKRRAAMSTPIPLNTNPTESQED